MSLNRALRYGLVVVLLLIGVGVMYAWLQPDQVYWIIGRLLVVDHVPQPCDAIYLLGGNYELRAPRAAGLFRDGRAPVVLLAREPEKSPVGGDPRGNFTDVTIDILRMQGVPTERVIQIKTPRGVTSTADEARALRTYSNAHALRRVLVVTSAIHSRRARMALSRSLWGSAIDLYMDTVEEPAYRTSDWWLTPYGRGQVESEYKKFFYYLVTFWG